MAAYFTFQTRDWTHFKTLFALAKHVLPPAALLGIHFKDNLVIIDPNKQPV